MRSLLLVVFMIVCSYATAQNPQVQKIPNLNIKGFTKAQLDSLLKNYNVKVQNGIVQVSPRLKAGIKILADGMPCIVPQEPTAGKIPNKFSGVLFHRNYRMPNPALPNSK